MIATGESHSVREFCELAFELAGLPITWQGKGQEEVGVDAEGKTFAYGSIRGISALRKWTR